MVVYMDLTFSENHYMGHLPTSLYKHYMGHLPGQIEYEDVDFEELNQWELSELLWWEWLLVSLLSRGDL